MTKVILKCGCAANAVILGILKPSCAIHDCTEIAKAQPNLKGRLARCCAKTPPQPSDPDRLAFFEFRGEGSPWATERCKCGYYEVAHGKPHVKCKGFEPAGPAEFDTYYCGHGGWD